MTTDLFARLLRNSEVPEGQADTGCWAWTGSLNSANYGRYPYRTTDVDEWGEPVSKVRHHLAHRKMEQLHRDQDVQLAADMAIEDTWRSAGTVTAPPLCPETETIEHLCCYRRCINPDHWIIVTRAENSALMQQRRKMK